MLVLGTLMVKAAHQTPEWMHGATAQRGTAPPEHLHGCPGWDPRAQRKPAASPRGEMLSASPLGCPGDAWSRAGDEHSGLVLGVMLGLPSSARPMWLLGTGQHPADTGAVLAVPCLTMAMLWQVWKRTVKSGSSRPFFRAFSPSTISSV